MKLVESLLSTTLLVDPRKRPSAQTLLTALGNYGIN